MNEAQKIELTGLCKKIGGSGATTWARVDEVKYLIPACLLRGLGPTPVGKQVEITALLVDGVGLITRIQLSQK